jgi:hypothetical protein
MSSLLGPECGHSDKEEVPGSSPGNPATPHPSQPAYGPAQLPSARRRPPFSCPPRARRVPALAPARTTATDQVPGGAGWGILPGMFPLGGAGDNIPNRMRAAGASQP